MALNITNVSNIQTMNDAGQFASDATGGLFWLVVTLSLFFIIVFKQMKNNSFDDTLISAGFVTFVFSLMMFLLGWMQIIFPIVFGLMTAGVMAYKKYNEA